jgi:hypothetical protein
MIEHRGDSTYQPSLVLAVRNTRGLILELGASFYSTEILHALSAGGRQIVTVDNDRAWLKQFRGLKKPWHHLHLVRDWKAFFESLARQKVGVCFVDQNPHGARGLAINMLRRRTAVFVAHDTEKPRDYGYEILDSFKYRRDDRRMPRTSIFSDNIDVSQWTRVRP